MVHNHYAVESHALLDQLSVPANMTVERIVVAARSVARGFLNAVAETDPPALVVGWQDRSRLRDVVLGTTVDSLVARAPCDLYDERGGRKANGVESVLLPIVGSTHVATAARVAGAVATCNDDTHVHVRSVYASGGDDPAAAEQFVDAGREALSSVAPDVPVVTRIVDTADVTGAIAADASAYDVVVLGATRQGAVRDRVWGTVARRVAGRTDQTVVLARAGRVPAGSFGSD
jgi:nucleotide-binding universal stress UspA family protein